MDNNQLKQILNAHKAGIESLLAKVSLLERGKTLEDEIEAIKGRRIFYNLVGSQTFSSTNDGARGNPINMLVSQDGPFVMMGYPLVLWRSSQPSNATDFGRWRPVCSAYLPTQQLTTNFIDLSWELTDGGSQRNFQNLAVPPLFSRPDAVLPLPKPTLFAPNTTIQFIPTYQDILLAGATPTTEGTLVVALPGYRIVQM